MAPFLGSIENIGGVNFMVQIIYHRGTQRFYTENYRAIFYE
jgi:hypothetical protein